MTISGYLLHLNKKIKYDERCVNKEKPEFSAPYPAWLRTLNFDAPPYPSLGLTLFGEFGKCTNFIDAPPQKFRTLFSFKLYFFY